MKELRELRDLMYCDTIITKLTDNGEVITIGTIDIHYNHIDIKDMTIITTKEMKLIQKIQKKLKKTCNKQAK